MIHQTCNGSRSKKASSRINGNVPDAQLIAIALTAPEASQRYIKPDQEVDVLLVVRMGKRSMEAMISADAD